MFPVIMIAVGILSIGVYIVGRFQGVEGIGGGGILLFWFGFLPLGLGIWSLFRRRHRGGRR